MNPTEFEALLDRAAQFLTTNLRTSTLYHGPEQFEQGVLAALQNAATDLDVTVEPDQRIGRWLAFADQHARDAGWKPSEALFSTATMA